MGTRKFRAKLDRFREGSNSIIGTLGAQQGETVIVEQTGMTRHQFYCSSQEFGGSFWVSRLQAFDFEASKECFHRGQAMTGHKTFKE